MIAVFAGSVLFSAKEAKDAALNLMVPVAVEACVHADRITWRHCICYDEFPRD